MSTAAVVCHSCANEVTGDQGDQISCQGYCNSVFHVKCSGLAENQLVAVTENMQLFWMCKSCTKLMSDARHRRSVQSALQTGQESFLSSHNQIVKELKGEILTELRTEIRTNFATLINSNSLTPKSQRRQGSKTDLLGKRLFGNKPAPGNQSQTDLLGTGQPVSPTLSSMFVTEPTPKFWLYITKISRHVTEEQVSKLAVERLGTPEVEVTRLVAKGKDVRTMSFISFRIGMDPALKEKALSTSTWPQGLVFREFEERSSANFWEPKDVSAKTTAPAAQATAETKTPSNPAVESAPQERMEE